MEKKGNKRNRGKIVLVLLAVMAAALTAAILGICRGRQEPDSKKQSGGLVVDTRATTAQTEETERSPLAGRSVYFSGIADTSISRDGVVQLDNREENLDFILKYEIYDAGTGELVFETDLIPSGQHVEWVPGEELEPGKHTLNFLQIPYYPDSSGEYIGLTQGSNKVILTILD